MNAMKKWLVAGLIGLFSVGVAMAAPDLDLNVDKWADNDSGDGHDVNFTASRLGTTAVTVNSVSDGAQVPPSAVTATAGGGSAGDRQATVTIDGPVASLQYKKISNPTGREAATFSLDYVWEADEVLFNDYSGMTIDFDSAVQIPFAHASTTYTLMMTYWRTDLGGYYENAYVDEGVLSTHEAGLLTLNWTDPTKWDYGGAFEPQDFTYIKSISISIYIEDPTTAVVGTTYTEKFNSIVLDGIGDVPEPETVWMIVAVLASLGVTFRRQLMARFVKA